MLYSCFSFRRVWNFSKEKVEQKRKRILPWSISAYSYTQFICHPSQLNFWIESLPFDASSPSLLIHYLVHSWQPSAPPPHWNCFRLGLDNLHAGSSKGSAPHRQLLPRSQALVSQPQGHLLVSLLPQWSLLLTLLCLFPFLHVTSTFWVPQSSDFSFFKSFLRWVHLFL